MNRCIHLHVKRAAYALILAWLLLILLSPIFLDVSASSTSTTLNPSADTYVVGDQGDSNYGSDEFFKIGHFSDHDYWVYIRFDLSSIPEGAAIISAKLKIYQYYQSSASGNLAVYRVTGDWSEEDITWNNKPSNADTASDTISTPTSSNVWVEFDVTDDVQGFVDGSYSNYGWVIKPEGWSGNGYAAYRSKEYSSSSYHPQLIVEYVEPNTVTQTVTETETVTETVTETTTVANTTITETQTETVTQTQTITETETQTITETMTTTQTINNTVTETVTTTVANTTYYTTIYETISPTYGNETANYYVDLTNQLMPLIMVIGVICTMLSLLLSATKGR